jgi:hypothetical protein
MMHDDEEEFDIEDDEPRNRRGDRVPAKPTKEQQEWEENRKRQQYRRNFRNYD